VEADEPGPSERPGPLKEFKPSVSLPVAISHGLHRAVILDEAIEIFVPEFSNGEDLEMGRSTIRTQPLDLEFQPGYESFFDIKFSPSGQHFVVIQESEEKQRKGRHFYGVRLKIQAFCDINHGTGHGPKYALHDSITC
jgi:hypothetical protein